MKWGTALVTDTIPRTLEDYEETNLEDLSKDSQNFQIPHESVLSFVKRIDRLTFKRSEFWVKRTM